MDKTFWKQKNVLVTGGAGFLGSHVVENLIHRRGVDPNNVHIPRSKDSDLTIWDNCVKEVKDMDIVIHLAAKVGGIGFNKKYPATLFYDNIKMGIQMMEAARLESVEKFVAIGTVCAYPKHTPVPFKEENLWDGYPEETNAPYGLAKKMLLVQAQAYRKQYDFNAIYLLPVNLYGPRDNFDPKSSHVIPALIKKMINANQGDDNEITVWGTGKASREFLYVEDAAEAIILATEKYDKPDPVNLGVGKEITIKELVNLLVELTNYEGKIVWDTSKPDGQPRRCLDTSKAKEMFNFEAKTDFRIGLTKTIEWYRKEGRIINKTLEDADLEGLTNNPVTKSMRQLVDVLTKQGFKVTTRGKFLDPDKYEILHPARCWEYSRQIEFSGVKKGDVVLDCGGASTPLIFYLASMGCDTHTIELKEELVENTNYVAKQMNWAYLHAKVMDMTKMTYGNDRFDVIFSTSVLEHMPKRAKIMAMKEMGRVLKPGGILALTFDYGGSVFFSHHPLNSLNEIQKILIEPSGLEIYGNKLIENKDEIKKIGTWFAGKRYTMYTLFLRKGDSYVY